MHCEVCGTMILPGHLPDDCPDEFVLCSVCILHHRYAENSLRKREMQFSQEKHLAGLRNMRAFFDNLLLPDDEFEDWLHS